MKLRILIALMALLAFIQPYSPTSALADSRSAATIDRSSPTFDLTPPTLEACPATTVKRLDLAQTQTDCCNMHKGLCGCRAGKLVCCDGTVSTSPSCTCHSDSGVSD